MEAYLGLDWSATEVVCAIAVGDEAPRPFGRCGPDLDEVRQLHASIRQQHPEVAIVHVGVEAGFSLWPRLFHAAGAVVHVLDARQVKNFASSLQSSKAKDDKRDASHIARMVRSPEHRSSVWTEDPVEEELQALERLHEQVTKEQTRILQQLRALLRAHVPLIEGRFRHLDRVWVLRVLRVVSNPVDAAVLTRTDFDELVRGSQAQSRDLLWEAIRRTAAPWMTESWGLSMGMRAGLMIDRIEQLMAQRKQLEEALSEALDRLPAAAALTQIAGIGTLQAASLCLYAFNGSISARDQAAVRIGAAPVFIGSARHRDGTGKGRAILRRSAPKRARRTAYLLGRLATQNQRWAKAQYQAARARGKNAATGYRIVARSMLRILTAVIRTGEPYDEQRYIDTLKQRGVVWAQDL